ncbi:hypothetical protein [Dactylosporangium salmoneum]|uniref:Uncharacterized protein n=1 Tax=Dactylosporangium salmoneum TaxID=53361 RepID=A0ABP5T839_9ACTN
MNAEDLTPPLEVFQALAADQARRWDYTAILDDPESLAAYLRERAADPNLRADVETVWRFAVFHFTGKTRSGGVL